MMKRKMLFYKICHYFLCKTKANRWRPMPAPCRLTKWYRVFIAAFDLHTKISLKNIDRTRTVDVNGQTTPTMTDGRINGRRADVRPQRGD